MYIYTGSIGVQKGSIEFMLGFYRGYVGVI